MAEKILQSSILTKEEKFWLDQGLIVKIFLSPPGVQTSHSREDWRNRMDRASVSIQIAPSASRIRSFPRRQGVEES